MDMFLTKQVMYQTITVEEDGRNKHFDVCEINIG